MSANTAVYTVSPREQFERSRTVLARILDNSAVAMVVSDYMGNAVYANQSFIKLLGHDPNANTSGNVLDLVHPEDLASARQWFKVLMRGEADYYHGEHRMQRADGIAIWVKVAASALPPEGPEQPGYLITQVTDIELQKKAEEALAHSESRLNFALESARQGVWDHDVVNDTMFYSRMWRTMRGMAPDEVVDDRQSTWLARIHPDDRAYVTQNVQRQDVGDDTFDALEYRELTRDGRYIWILSRGRPVEWDANGNPTRTLGTDTDVTRIKTVEQELAAERQRLRITLDSMADGMISTDANGVIVFINYAEAVGMRVEDVFRVRSGNTGEDQICPVATCLNTREAAQLDDDTVLVSLAGGERDIRCTATPVKMPDGKAGGAVLVFQDVTQSRAIQRELAHSATHDDLTGIANRAHFERTLNAAVVSANENNSTHCLLYVDLDRFKAVNDNAGHAAGDELLRRVASTMRGLCRSNDMAARIGGDEFAVLLHDCSEANGMMVSEKIVSAISAIDFVWEGATYKIGACVGLTVITADLPSSLGHMGEADAACYAAKAQGKGRAIAYSELGKPGA
jgi:diguanylate cyclase (GGDEF)-like protein/PAS domain S-box-containing protein